MRHGRSTFRMPALAVAALAAAMAGCAGLEQGAPTEGTASPAPTDLARSAEEGGVTATARWVGAPAEATFEITLDTHSVDLDPLDLADSRLSNDRGQTLSARPWAAANGGHHRTGRLTFDGEGAAFFAGARWFELLLRDVGGVAERSLRWEIVP